MDKWVDARLKACLHTRWRRRQSECVCVCDQVWDREHAPAWGAHQVKVKPRRHAVFTSLTLYNWLFPGGFFFQHFPGFSKNCFPETFSTVDFSHHCLIYVNQVNIYGGLKAEPSSCGSAKVQVVKLLRNFWKISSQGSFDDFDVKSGNLTFPAWLPYKSQIFFC